MSRSNLIFLTAGLVVFLLAGIAFIVQRINPQWLSSKVPTFGENLNSSPTEAMIGPQIERAPQENIQARVQAETEKILRSEFVPKTKIPTPKGAQLISLQISDTLAEFNFNRAIVESGGASYEAVTHAIYESAYTLIQGRQTIVRYPNLIFSIRIEGEPAAEYFSKNVQKTTQTSNEATPFPSVSPIPPAVPSQQDEL